MAAIGRLDVARSLKRLLELTGSFGPELGEGIVPTIQIFDLEDTPFGPSTVWCVTVQQLAVLAQFSHIAVVTGPGLGENGWVSIDEIWFHNGGGNYNIFPTTESQMPMALAAMTAVTQPRSRRQPGFLQGSEWLVPEVRLFQGANAVALSAAGMRTVASVTDTQIIPVKVSLRSGGALVVSSFLANADVLATFMGRIHMTSAK